MRLDELARTLDVQLLAPHRDDHALVVDRVDTLDDAGSSAVTFLTNPAYLSRLVHTRAAAVIMDEGTLAAHGNGVNRPLLVAKEARVTVARAIGLLHPTPIHRAGISPEASVHSRASLGAGVCIMPFAYVGKATLGKDCVVYPHVFIDDDVVIGDGALIYPHVTLMRGTRVGARAILHAGSVLGADGFGFAPSASGRVEKFPQVGDVELGDDVEVGANTAIDRGALGTTRLGNQVKLDNMVQIGHNTQLGNGVMIAGKTAVAGSVKIGDGAIIGGAAAIAGHITIGKGAKLAGGSQTIHSVPDGEVWAGTPSQPRTAWARQTLHLRNLAKHLRTIRLLQGRVTALERLLMVQAPG